MPLLSKSSFKKFLQCPEYFWFDQHKPDVLPPVAMNDFEQMLAEQGKRVEEAFYALYPELIRTSSKGLEAVRETNHILKTGGEYVAQAAFATPELFAQSDLVHFKGDQHIDLCEIKSSSSMQHMDVEGAKPLGGNEEHEADLAFQYEVATQAGYVVDNTYLIELNKSYIRQGEPDLKQLFTCNNVTYNVLKKLPEIRQDILQALTYAKSTAEPVTCSCIYKARKKQCPAFSYLHPELAGYSIYDLPRIYESRIRELVDQQIFRIEDIPANIKLSENQRDHIQSWNENLEIIRKDEIEKTLNALPFPLYFLDYETYAPAIPVFEGTRPYQHIPFQYSLHIIRGQGMEPEHEKYLHPDKSKPIEPISRHLRTAIGDTGTIIVWNKTFETKCNETLAQLLPELSGFLLGMNHRMFDLMEIFSKRMYVHKDFRGSSSIKKVLPVLVPELSYDSLPIRDGGTATTQWGRMVFDLEDEKEKEIIYQNLLAYCRLDTLAMVEVYRKILEKIQ